MSRFASDDSAAFERCCKRYFEIVGVPTTEEATPNYQRSAMSPEGVYHLRNRYANPLAVVMPDGQVYDRPGGHLLGPAP